MRICSMDASHLASLDMTNWTAGHVWQATATATRWAGGATDNGVGGRLGLLRSVGPGNRRGWEPAEGHVRNSDETIVHRNASCLIACFSAGGAALGALEVLPRFPQLM